jgi:hypothetical protein
MKKWPKPGNRWVAPIVLGLGLVVAPAYSAPAHAQEEVPTAEEGTGSGRPLDGYLATIVLALLALFIVGRSARR